MKSEVIIWSDVKPTKRGERIAAWMLHDRHGYHYDHTAPWMWEALVLDSPDLASFFINIILPMSTDKARANAWRLYASWLKNKKGKV